MLWLLLMACKGQPDPPMRGSLAACWSSPNCVSSQADPGDSQHYVEPLSGAFQTVLTAAQGLPGCVEVHSEPGSAVLECSTPSGLFTDDLHLTELAGEVHVRSSSRLGHDDLGVNRKRVEALREGLQ